MCAPSAGASLRGVPLPSPQAPAAPRRRHTRQRARILELVRGTEQHPSAAWIHRALLPEFRCLSLGTVYRNLEVLVSDGVLLEVAVPGGPTRYDAKLQAHHHFLCEACGGLEDVELRLPPGLARRLRRRYGLRARGYRIDFHGLCRSCADRAQKPHPREESPKPCRS